mgnify:CR=1 FL=1
MIDLKSIGHSVWDIIIAFFRGEIFLKMKLDKYFVHIIFVFLLAWVTIILKILAENTFEKVESNKKTLKSMQIYHTEKMVEMARLGRMSKTGEMLKERGSVVAFPIKPADTIDSEERQ